jgi:hypothetical protein
MLCGMTRVQASHFERDLTSLRVAADRAGTALACLFSSADEFEAEVIRVRRLQGLLVLPPDARAHRRKRRGLKGACIALLSAAFLMV